MTLTNLAAIVLVAGMCGSPSGPLTTGLTGTALRGPITPVCVVASFQSDADGRFVVKLPPGTYTIRPANDAPIIDPAAQAKTATVAAEGLTEIQLRFDTGLR